ncbi:pas domain s-box protein [Stylonychia lemnae]|uniref:Pas domain s-box protein n=1 Tax=Stylonychia lemnae TaxID=5949 RepID=A0A078B658_STYLE|nr:pas domain s-box protein [Stylonychia lemnae]|eukprot:CDW89008.1 pas domain s-box protein [Stylonychia lemnae]
MLTATVSHDMRTPLNVINGLLNNLDSYITNDVGRRFLGIIKNSSKFMSFLVNDLLDFFQIKHGKFKKNLMWVDFKSSIKELMDIFKVGADEKGIHSIYSFSPNFPKTLYIDAQRIKQVILNLLQNSLKFTFQGFIKLEVSYDYLLSTIKLSVSDSGIGIQPEDRGKLFTLFGKLEATQQINTNGIGIGLNICRQIVEMFQGTIELDGNHSPGCKFNLTLKSQHQEQEQEIKLSEIDFEVNFESNRNRKNLSQRYKIEYGNSFQPKFQVSNCSTDSLNCTQQMNLSQQQAYRQTPIQSEPMLLNTDLKKKCSCPQLNSILIVDDNIFNLVTLEAILSLQFKLEVDQARNGMEAVQKVQDRFKIKSICDNNQCHKSIYKLILMDCNMPIMDGFQATQEIRKIEATIDKPKKSYIAALTAYSTDSFQQKCLDFGMDAFLTKPISADQLNKILKDNSL